MAYVETLSNGLKDIYVISLSKLFIIRNNNSPSMDLCGTPHLIG